MWKVTTCSPKQKFLDGLKKPLICRFMSSVNIASILGVACSYYQDHIANRENSVYTYQNDSVSPMYLIKGVH